MTGVLDFDYVQFTGAYCSFDDEGEKQFSERDPIMINRSSIDAFYDHTIIVGGRTIRVMQTYDEIKAKLR